jgi:very-short-patch-repair endonuclease
VNDAAGQVMSSRSEDGVPPPKRGRSTAGASEASAAQSGGGQPASRFDRTPEKTNRARNLRRAATNIEARLWSKLRRGQLDGLSFRRQHCAGPYVLDFYCPQLRLAIEVDGGQHSEAAQRLRDGRRTAWLQQRGVTELRFWNNDITQNLFGVLERIKSAADELRARGMPPTRRWRADLPLPGGGVRV